MPYPTTPRTWVAGDVLTAGQLNAELRDALLGAFPLGPPDAVWTAWTPTLTNLTLGNGTMAAAYTRTGRTVHYRFKFTLGSTSTVGTNPIFTVPVNMAGAYGGDDPVGDGSIRDASAGITWRIQPWWASASTLYLLHYAAAGTAAVITATAPFTWATGDVIRASGSYEAAP